MLKMRDVYMQNPALGDPSTLDKQLEENAQKLDKLKQEMQKFEVGFVLQSSFRITHIFMCVSQSAENI